MIALRALVAAAMLLLAGSPEAVTVTVSPARTVAGPAQLDPPALAGRTRPDAPVVTLPDGRRLVSHVAYRRGADGAVRGAVEHVLLDGPREAPYRSVAWRRPTCARAGASASNSPRRPLACIDELRPGGTDTDAVPGSVAPTAPPVFTEFSGHADVVSLWFVGAHAPDAAEPGELLGFLHEERIGGSGGRLDDAEGITAIALARSTDGGDTWRYLGRIATAHGSGGVGPRADTPAAPHAGAHNVQGAPWVVEGGHYLLYHVDHDVGRGHPGIAVSRAPVAEVLERARRGEVGDVWRKRSRLPDGAHGWLPSSTDPVPAYVMEKPTWARPGNAHLWPLRLWGITHVQAVTRTRSSSGDRPGDTAPHHFMVLTGMNGDGGTPDDPRDDVATWVRLFGSRDGLLWEPQAWLVAPDDARRGGDLGPAGAGTGRSAGGAVTMGRGGYQFCALAGADASAPHRFDRTFEVDCVRETASRAPSGRGPRSGRARPDPVEAWDRRITLVRWRISVGD